MKRTSRLGWFVTGVLAAVMVLQLTSPSLAALAGKTIQVFTGVNVYVDDQLVQPKDAKGNPVEVFVYNGTTYLPIRAIGEALGKPVQWEGKTNSAYVGKHKSDKPTVWLKDLDYFTGSEIRTTTMTDNLGQVHYESIYNDFSSMYLLNGQYTAISGTLFQNYECRSSSREATLKVYGDGELLYQAKMSGGVQPIDFSVDITGVLELEVRFDNAAGEWGGYIAAVTDLGLWA